MELLNNLKNREPVYDVRYHDMIMNFTIEQGGEMGTQSELERWEQGKFFSTRYEIYMYASIIGLKNNYRDKLPDESENKKSFIAISSWKPEDLVDFILMGVIAKSGIDFNELEYKEDKVVEDEVIKYLRRLIEEFANGGFEMIKSRYDEDPDFFENNDNCFLDLLDELTPEEEKQKP